jgi:hypothetical protein
MSIGWHSFYINKSKLFLLLFRLELKNLVKFDKNKITKQLINEILLIVIFKIDLQVKKK